MAVEKNTSKQTTLTWMNVFKNIKNLLEKKKNKIYLIKKKKEQLIKVHKILKFLKEQSKSSRKLLKSKFF